MPILDHHPGQRADPEAVGPHSGPLYALFQGLTGMVDTRMLRSVPGKPSDPEASSLYVDWLPAL
ncbi:hypothetical protein, partial [uncultured Thiodictyon sp.]|uniref:hypothetical protein n=1 Tax=uncultured Thiodictyon sp. TaxID=1846217 RepID=UPI0025F0400A